MRGHMFQYEVRVRKLTWLPKKGIWQYSGWWHGFSTIKVAIEFCSENPPYEKYSLFEGILKSEWIIEITLQDVVLETLSPADWKSLKEPLWKHPDDVYVMSLPASIQKSKEAVGK